MPTAAQFRQAKTEVEDSVSALSRYVLDMRLVVGATGFAGGTIPRKVDDYIEDSAEKHLIAINLARDLIEELEWRASECDKFHARTAQWNNDLSAASEDDIETVRAQKPYPLYDWID